MVMRQVAPRPTVGAVVLAHGSPLTFTQVGPPQAPVIRRFTAGGVHGHIRHPHPFRSRWLRLFLHGLMLSSVAERRGALSVWPAQEHHQQGGGIMGPADAGPRCV